MSNGSANEDYIWADDRLGRSDDAKFLVRFLLGRSAERQARGLRRSYVLNIDARWGHGKTFFLERLQKQLKHDGHPVCYVNAWKDDHAEDPLLAVMSAIDETLDPFIKLDKTLRAALDTTLNNAGKIAIAVGKGLLKTAVRRAVGEAFEEIQSLISGDHSKSEGHEAPPSDAANDSEAVQAALDTEIESLGNDLINRFRQEKRSIEHFQNSLERVLSGIGNRSDVKLPMFVLIDELDRCRPSYAIALLERVKHLFEVENTIFIVATDSQQLQHSIKVLYGSDFESGRYLRRFFDRSFRFREPSLTEFVDYLFAKTPIDSKKFLLPPHKSIEQLFRFSCDAQKISLRDTEQCFELLQGVATTWDQEAGLETLYLIPFIVAFQVDDVDTLNALKAFGYNQTFNVFGHTKAGNGLNIALQSLVSVLDQPILDTLDKNRLRNHDWLHNHLSLEIRHPNSHLKSNGHTRKSLICEYQHIVEAINAFKDPT